MIYSDIFKSDDTVPGDIIDVPENFKSDDFYLSINEEIKIDITNFPELDGNVFPYDFSDVTLEQEINNPSPTENDRFGSSVSIYGDSCIIGAYLEDTGEDNAGSVYIFTRSGTSWSLEQEIHNPSPTADDYFGSSVAIYGDTCIIGAYQEDTGGSAAGSVYIYTRSGTTWSLQQEIHNPSPTADDKFGYRVSIYSDSCIIGAYLEDTGEDDAGSVYIYTRSGTTWSLEQEINNPSPVADDKFGDRVSIYGDTCIISAYGDDTGESSAGSVYIYTRSGTTWSLEQEINNPSPTADDYFGYSVSIYGDTCIISASHEDTGFDQAGSVYIYTRSGTTWSLEQEIHNPSPTADDRFGFSVSIYSDTCIISASYEDTGESGAGSAYIYTRSGTSWSLEQEIHNPSPTADDNFGWSVSIYSDSCIIGAYQEDTGADSAGSAYVFTADSTDILTIQGTNKALKIRNENEYI